MNLSICMYMYIYNPASLPGGAQEGGHGGVDRGVRADGLGLLGNPLPRYTSTLYPLPRYTSTLYPKPETRNPTALCHDDLGSWARPWKLEKTPTPLGPP